MTPAERKDLAQRLEAAGVTNMTEIARRLKISPTTVAVYLGRRTRDEHRSPSPRIHCVHGPRRTP